MSFYHVFLDWIRVLREDGVRAFLLRVIKYTARNTVGNITLTHESYGNFYEDIHLFDHYSPWNEREFASVYDGVEANTVLTVYRLYGLWEAVSETSHLEGDILEVGVWKGGSGVMMAQRAQELGDDCNVYLCDTFKGVVKATQKDPGYEGGEYDNAAATEVRRLADEFDVEVEIVEGVFPDETAGTVGNTFKLCHIDVDTHESAKDVLEWVWPRLVVGGWVVFDDYAFPNMAGVNELVNEYRERDDRAIIYNLNGQAIMVKCR